MEEWKESLFFTRRDFSRRVFYNSKNKQITEYDVLDLQTQVSKIPSTGHHRMKKALLTEQIHVRESASSCELSTGEDEAVIRTQQLRRRVRFLVPVTTEWKKHS